MFESDEFNRSLFFPRREVSPCPADARDLWIDVDGARLHARVHREAGARAVVLLFHGNAEIVSDYDEAASSYARVGAALAVVDYRGYGASTGLPTLFAILDDAPVVLDAIARAVDAPLVVMGRSLGSACANELYGANDARVQGVILESGFCDVDGLARRRNLDPRAISADERARVDPLPKLARGTQPLLVIHGAEDRLIAADEGRRAFDAAGTRDQTLVIVDGRGHNDVSRAGRYWDAMERFLARIS